MSTNTIRYQYTNLYQGLLLHNPLLHRHRTVLYPLILLFLCAVSLRSMVRILLSRRFIKKRVTLIKSSREI